MKKRIRFTILILPLLALFVVAVPAQAIFVQCAEDTDGVDADGDGDPANDIICTHISGSDGFARMGDGRDMYMFSFGRVPPGTDASQVISEMSLKAESPAPTITMNEGQELYLTMSNVGMVIRPDLFDTHTVHWHGFHNAAPIFDGLPEPSPSAIMGASFTYYYQAVRPGTYFYHCHVEAAEHMQMGMIGNIWIYPIQDQIGYGGDENTIALRSPNNVNPDAPYGYVYNDGDGSTAYDVEYPLQLTGFDSFFHDASELVQPLPFSAMFDNYPLINGRGYPDTVDTGAVLNNDGFAAQKISSLIEAEQGDRILLRVSNISTTHSYSIATTLGVPMRVVGRGAFQLRGPTGLDTSFEVNVLNVGGGQMFDVIIDTGGVPPGTYFLYSTDLANLANGDQERGGMMTEIVISPGV